MNCFFREFVDDLQRVWTLCKDAQFEKPNSSDKVRALCKTAKVENFFAVGHCVCSGLVSICPRSTVLCSPLVMQF
jgi:hypothetical protein